MTKKKKRRGFLLLKVSYRLIAAVCALALLISYLSIFINPQHFPFISFFGLYYIPIAIVNVILLLIAILRRSKGGWIPFITLLPSLFFAEFYIQFGNREEISIENEIKILSYNVGRFSSGKGDFGSNLKGISQLVKEENPDIITFQEYRTSDTLDIKRNFPNYPFVQQRFFHFSKGKQFVGNIILSKYPIISSGKIPFTNTTNLATYSDIDIGGKVTRIYNLHLESNSISLTSMIKKINGTYEEFSNEVSNVHQKVKKSNNRRSEQVKMVIEHIEKCPFASIVCGDFNDTPMSYSFRKLYDGRKDTFKERGNGFGATYATLWPLLRIDYILTPERYTITDHKTRRVRYSDHYPIMAKFSSDTLKSDYK